MKAKLLKPTTDTELEKYHSREEVLVARGIREVVEWLDEYFMNEPWCDPDDKQWQAKLKEWRIDNKAL